MKNIGKYIALLVITIVTLSFTYNKSMESREMVYVCDSARVKCYFKVPCKKLTIYVKEDVFLKLAWKEL